MNSVMLTATQARAKSRNDNVIFNEIRNLEQAILDAIDAGQLEVYVSGTAMTDIGSGIAESRIYSKVWQGIVDDRPKDQRMAAVIKYFTELGYQIDRRTNPSTGDTFRWAIFW